jgi:voltage-gated potassium channel
MRIQKNLVWSCSAVLAVVLGGTFGYSLVGGSKYSLIDCLYMTMITITSVGYGEVIDLSNSPVGRLFTIFVAVTGIGLLAYLMSNVTAILVEGELTDSFARRKMEKTIGKYSDHYIVCGMGMVGLHVLREMFLTGRPCVAVDLDVKAAGTGSELMGELLFVEGDATDESVLLRAGMERAKGLFAATRDDSRNLVIVLTAKQINPSARVIARCQDVQNAKKMERVGADAVVSPTQIGGLRMASEMVRPTVVSFLDMMLRDREKNLRVEESRVPERFAGRRISDLGLKRFPDILLLAVRERDKWVYNPPEDLVFESENVIVYLSSPQERERLEAEFRRG